MKHQTATLSGPLLDAAVLKLEYTVGPPRTWAMAGSVTLFFPSTDWADGGPIIEREGIAIWRRGPGEWEAFIGAVLFDYDLQSHDFMGTGQTPLIAAMRAFCLAKLGPEVDLP